MSTKPRQWFDVDPNAYDWRNPRKKIWCDLEALKIIMKKTTWTQAVQSTLLLLFWMAWTVMILQGQIEVSERYSRLMFMAYGGVSIVLGIIFGRQWGFQIAEVTNTMAVFSPGRGDHDYAHRGSPEDYNSPQEIEDETDEYPDD